jgi:hydrogenase maturation factor
MAESDRLEDRIAISDIDSLPPGACALDHDGCVVCSDAGIPLRIISLEGDDALCEDAAGNRASIAVELVAPVHIGDVLLTHGGVAIGLASRTGEVTDEVCQ